MPHLRRPLRLRWGFLWTGFLLQAYAFLMRELLLVVILAGCSTATAQSSSSTVPTSAPHEKAQITNEDPTQAGLVFPFHPVTVEQVREYFALTKADEIYRAGWLAALAMNRSKGAPYWPESFWVDLRHAMETADLAPSLAIVYQKVISAEMMGTAITALRKQSVADFAATPFGASFCKLQQSTDADGKAATLSLTQTTFMSVYARHKVEIDDLRSKYAAEHPGWVER